MISSVFSIESIPHPFIYISDHQLSELLYADDLVVLSTSKKGLQKFLDELNIFCLNKKLDVNLSKTKCITFSRRGDKEKNVFTFNGKPIDNADSYKYLGVVFSRKNASFNKTMYDLSIKANKAMHALHTKFKLSNVPIKVLFKIFDAMIVPILLYCSEIWSTFSGLNEIKWDACEIEKQHTQMIKRSLGVNRSTPNNMAKAEVGRTPLQLQAKCRTWSYIKYIKNKKDSELVKKAYDFETSNTDPNFKLGISIIEKDFKNTFKTADKNANDIYNISTKKCKTILQNNYY